MSKKTFLLIFFGIVLMFLTACEPVSVDEMIIEEVEQEEKEIEEILKEVELEEEKEEVKEIIEEVIEEITETPEVLEVKKVEEEVEEEVQEETEGRKGKTVVIENLEFFPGELIIFPDTDVTWINKDSLPHKITGAGFSSGVINQDGEFKHTFTRSGKYQYTDEFHPSLGGYVNVIDIASLGININEPEELVWVSIERYNFNPSPAEIKKGQTVLWENRDPMAHTVKGPGFDSGVLMGGKTFHHKFDQIGTYPYECTKHDHEKGTIVVS